MANKAKTLTLTGVKTLWNDIKSYIDNGLKRVEETARPVEADATLNKESTNPIQNQAVAKAIDDTLGNIASILESI